MKVVSDSSPLITLAKIGQLELLPLLYQRIAITPQVYHEVVVDGEGLVGSSEINTAKWIDIQSASTDDLAVAQQASGLGIGELSAIKLSQEISADLVLLDEIKARRVAVGHGLTGVGVRGYFGGRVRQWTANGPSTCLPAVAYLGRLCRSENS